MTTNTTLTLAQASVALVAMAVRVDRLAGEAEPVKQAWAERAALDLKAGTITMDGVATALVDAAKAKAGVRKGKLLNSIADVSKGYSSTLAGWYYDLRRVEKAGLLDRLVQGEALTTLRRGTPSTQAPSKRKGKGKATAGQSDSASDAEPSAPVTLVAPQSFDAACTALIEACKRAKVPTIAKSHQLALANAQQALATLARQVEAHIKANAERKVARKASRKAA